MSEMPAKKVLIIGAGGFIGGFIARESLRRGFDTWCAVRESTSRRFLDDPRLHFVTVDYTDAGTIRRSLEEALPEGERWQWVVYNLGATKCTNFSDFNRINYDTLRHTVAALEDAALMPERFLYMSSLSALGTGDEKGYTPFDEHSIPNPCTRYGLSKMKSETFLQTRGAFPWTIFRPTGVYGPHDQDYLMMLKAIDKGWDVGVGFRKQLLTFIYVEDLAAAIFDALGSPCTLHKTYIISEERAYTQAEFRHLAARLLGRRHVVALRLPLWAVKGVSAVAEKIGVLRMQPSTLNRDKYIIMRQRNWSCDVSAAKRDFRFAPKHTLEAGLRKTIEAYRNGDS